MLSRSPYPLDTALEDPQIFPTSVRLEEDDVTLHEPREERAPDLGSGSRGRGLGREVREGG